MLIREYPQIKKDGKVIINKTNDQHVIHTFVKQMEQRGDTVCSFYVNKDKMHKTDNPDDFSGFSWTSDFNSDDLLNLVLSFADTNFDTKQKMIFITQLQNIFVNESMDEDYDDNDDDDDYQNIPGSF